MQIEYKQQLAQRLAGISAADGLVADLQGVVDGYFARVFATVDGDTTT
jgi:hypothetical protein